MIPIRSSFDPMLIGLLFVLIFLMAIKIVSFNCYSVNSNTEVLKLLLSKCDIMLLQETLLSDDNSGILQELSEDFDFAHVPAVRKQDNFRGRASGGLAILWRRFTNLSLTPVYFSNRIMGLRLSIGEVNYLILNVYLTCDYGTVDSLVEYKSTISQLSNIMTMENFSDIFIVGDFNCDPRRGRFFEEFKNLSITHSLEMCDILELSCESFTYISSNLSCSTSWLDHILSSNGNLIQNIDILYGTTFYDHVPMIFEIIIPDTLVHEPSTCLGDVFDEEMLVNWSILTENDIVNYADSLEYFIEGFHNEGTQCHGHLCTDMGHKLDIEEAFTFLKGCIFTATSVLPAIPKKRKFKKIPGWNDHCKDLYQEARHHFLLWNRLGRIRQGCIFEGMKNARSKFKKALNFCKVNEMKLRKQKLVSSFNHHKNKNRFWKNVRKLKSQVLVSTIDGINDPKSINEVFCKKYKNVLDDVNSQSGIIQGSINENDDVQLFYIYFTESKINDSIVKLNNGLGFDMIHSNHIKFSGKKLRAFIGRLLSVCLSHSFIPKSMLDGVIRPGMKDNLICKYLSDNYRPIMNSSIFFKLLEYCLEPPLKRSLSISPLQFGFTEGSDCDAAIIVTKEIINSYRKQGSSVHCAAIDLSMAFDKINYKLLINKLIRAYIPIPIIRMLTFMFEKTFVKVCFGGYTGDEWKVGNGVRQGGILSSLLFNFYIDEVICSISSLDVGCNLEFSRTNIIVYADDILLMAPTASGLQLLIDSLGESLKNLCLVPNPSKSKYIVFKQRRTMVTQRNVNLDGVGIEKVTEIKYLGVILNEDLNLGNDVGRVLGSFLKQFNAMFYQFYFLPMSILSFLFKTYTSSFYGMNLWTEEVRVKDFHKLAVGYHKAVKKVANMNVWSSNHEACQLVGVNHMNHLFAKRLVKFYNRVINSKVGTLRKFRYFFMLQSALYRKVSRICEEQYDITSLCANDFMAILARIDFVEREEPRSQYYYEPP